jgi:(1->4)-alpha-D-glucan 1-alpha-D-glucosylmutase
VDRFICIHGHFYQPPRENPWLETIELQDSAYPYHDWNERITAQCYAPNAVARIHDAENKIVHLVNNYTRISFDFGPTLLAWMRDKSADVYRALLDADQESQNRFGYGSALALPYNDMCLPLANRRDKFTQAFWGVRDFERTFNRKPDGMWLPDGAVDIETLEVLAELGIRFTLLAPHQAARVRKIGSEEWQDVSGGRIDTTRAYLQRLPSGKSINLFFFEPRLSNAVAAEGLLIRGENLSDRLLGAFRENQEGPQLVHIATSGEIFGHHHRYGDMSLAYALHHIENSGKASLTNHAAFLEKFPPAHEVEIVEKSSITCPHGVERWRSDCGCSTGHPGWTQAWRGPLREAFDWLRDTLAAPFEEVTAKYLKDPWAARNDSIDLIDDRSEESLSRFLHRHALRDLKPDEVIVVRKLLEIQRHLLLMYTSAGWFHDDLSTLETVQVLTYTARVLQLAEALFHQDFEEEFLTRLDPAKSNLPERGNGRTVFETQVRPVRVDWEKVGVQYAVGSLFEDHGPETRIYCARATALAAHAAEAGKAKLRVGWVRTTSEITGEFADLEYGALHFGDHNINAGVRRHTDDETYETAVRELSDAFGRGDFPEVIRLLDRHFGNSTYNLQSLFRDEQRKVIKRVLGTPLAEAEATYRQLYQQNHPTMRFLAALGTPLPLAFQTTAEFLLNSDLRAALREEHPNLKHIRAFLEEASLWNVRLDTAGLEYQLKKTIGRMSGRLRDEPGNLPLLTLLKEVIDLARSRPFEVGLWLVQNVYFHLMSTAFPDFVRQLEEGDANALPWLEQFVQLGDTLGIQVADLKKKIAEARTIPSVPAVVEEIFATRRLPVATYRLQLNKTFTFNDARAIVPYLHELGICDAYASPIQRARPGSMHGYDITDHSQINPELGTEADFNEFSRQLREYRMGLILDVVPNHMGIGDPSNLWWNDVLENGPSSLYASHFDIDWQPVNPGLENKVLLPVLEDQYGRVLEEAKLKLGYDNGSFFLSYYSTRLPLAPRTYANILSNRLDALKESLGAENESVQELQSILTALGHLPPRTEQLPEKIAERNREKEVIKRRIAALYSGSAEIRAAVDESVQDFNGESDEPRSFDHLDALLDAQAYRPAYWRVATEEINYRRFFDINELAAIRVELPEVFQAAHAVPMRLLAESKATGLRIDHPDGLWNPTDYFRQLQDMYVRTRVRARLAKHRSVENIDAEIATATEAARAERGEHYWPLYVVAEKILLEDEPLPRDWAVFGTVGYDFLTAVLGIFIDISQRERFDQIYVRIVGSPPDFEQLVNSTKKMVMLISLASEINALSHQLDRVSEKNRRYRDFTLNSLTHAVREIIAALPVYRTYITGPESVSLRDRRFIESAVAEAKRQNPRTAESIFNFIQDTLLLTNINDFAEEDQPRLIHWVMKFQQITGPVTAKAVEDTSFYSYNRLVALNEVGGSPERFGLSIEAFHKLNLERQEHWPHEMLGTSTHDTKRSEDVRARLAVLSELPDEWESAVLRWLEMNAGKHADADGNPAPDRNDEYLLYQTLIGAWPEQPCAADEFARFRDRVIQYMQKATKEAKVHTSWINPNDAYDNAVKEFITRLLPENADDAFRKDASAFARRVSYFGHFNSLSQTLLKLTCPGVPDIYQGTELWDYSLVDPDNRRPVDYELRRRVLAELQERARHGLTDLAKHLVESAGDGRVKLFLMHRALDFRRAHRALLAEGQYVPLEATGPKAWHVFAFARIWKEQAVVVVVPRLIAGLLNRQERPPLGADLWQDTRLVLPETHVGRKFRNLFTGEIVTACTQGTNPCLSVAQVFESFPAGILELQPANS